MSGPEFDSINWVASNIVMLVGELTILYFMVRGGSKVLMWCKVESWKMGSDMVGYIKRFVKS